MQAESVLGWDHQSERNLFRQKSMGSAQHLLDYLWMMMMMIDYLYWLQALHPQHCYMRILEEATFLGVTARSNNLQVIRCDCLADWG